MNLHIAAKRVESFGVVELLEQLAVIIARRLQRLLASVHFNGKRAYQLVFRRIVESRRKLRGFSSTADAQETYRGIIVQQSLQHLLNFRISQRWSGSESAVGNSRLDIPHVTREHQETG